MTHSFPHRMVAVPVRILLALFTDPLATLADVAFYVALALTFWALGLLFRALWQLIVRIERWIARHVRDNALDREYATLCDSYSDADSTDGPQAESGEIHYLPGVTRIGPATPPPVGRQIRRRRMPGVRIPGRPRARRHTSASSDRSSRP